MIKTVWAKRFRGWNISWNLNILSGPKFTIQCGECESTFKERIQVVDYPRVKCPLCGTINKLYLKKSR